MAFRFGDSFSHYATAQLTQKWTSLIQSGSGSACTIGATSGRRGGGAMQVVTAFLASTFAQKTLDNQATWVIGVAINLTVGTNVGLLFVQDGSVRQIGLAINSNGTLYIEKNGTTLSTSSSVIISGWNYIELAVTFNGGSGSAVVNVNGGQWISYSGNVTHTANDYANSVCLGDWLGPHTTTTLIYADFYVLDGTGSINTFWGDIQVEANVPTGNGNYTQFATTGAGSAHAAVSEIPPDGDTSYVSSQTVGNRSSFTFPAPPGTVATAHAIQTVLDARKQGSGTREILASLRISGTDYDGTAVGVSTTYAFYIEPRELNPSTSAPWGSTDFATLEVGIELAS